MQLWWVCIPKSEFQKTTTKDVVLFHNTKSGTMVDFWKTRLPVEGYIPDEIIKTSEIWIQKEFLCKNYILNALDDSLYDVYHLFQT